MAAGTYYGVNYTKSYQTTPPVPVHASHQGKTLTMMDTVESLTATGLDAGSTVAMLRPPKGARWTGIGAIYSDDLGSSVTLAVGTGATKYGRSGKDVDPTNLTPVSAVTAAFGAATSHASATKTLLGLAGNIDYVGYEFDGETDIIVTTAGATMTTAKTITLVMQFIVA